MNRKYFILLFALFTATLPLTSFMGVGVSAPVGAGIDVTCATVSDLFSIRPRDGQIVNTTGYSTVGIGANTYRYSASSIATVDGGFVLPGIGGTLTWSGTTFTGDAGDGRWLAVDTSVADVTQFGAVHDGTTNDWPAIQRAINTVETMANRPDIVFPVGEYATESTTRITEDCVTLRGLGSPSIYRGADSGGGFVTRGATIRYTGTGTGVQVDGFTIEVIVAFGSDGRQ